MNQHILDQQPISVYSHPKPRPIVIQPDDPSYKLIPLTKGQVALVDAEDYERLSIYYWQAHWSKITETYYAQRAARSGSGKGVHVSMHREIMGVTDRQILVDHKSRDLTLDNRKQNLRIATRSQNGWNSKIQRNSRSGVKGVYWNSTSGKWIASVTVNYKHRHLGSFSTKEEAAIARREAALATYGEFAFDDVK